MENRVSFRQVGKDKAGKLYKGPILDGYNRVSQPSIPSKYELVLAKQEDVKEGFGHRSSRFETSFSHNPGPGHYPTEDVKSASPSFSHKGFLCGFVSDSKRFTSKQYKTAAPGPGAYTPAQPKSAKTPSSSFVPPQYPSKKRQDTLPGPGDYDTEIPKKPAGGVMNAFKSKTNRSENIVKTDAPAPWHYNPSDKLIRSSSQEFTRAFRQPINARRFQVNLYDPHSQVGDEPTPGPGHYQEAASFEAGSVNSSFVKQDVDRFGQPLRAKRARSGVPGPGAYTVSTEKREKLPVSGAVFMSESKRDDSFQSKAPGPAFYRPVILPKKKSFHLNAERKWV